MSFLRKQPKVTPSNRFRRLFSLSSASHTVFNQSQPFVNVDLYQSDRVLSESISAFSQKFSMKVDTIMLKDFGAAAGTESMMNHADLAEKNRPVLRQFDHYGRRIDTIEYHPSYHVLMEYGLSKGAAAYGFKHSAPGSQLTRASLIYMENQLEAGHCCPIVMTAAAIPLLQRYSQDVPLVALWLQKILRQGYDPRLLPVGEKMAVTVGMSMTEKQGGSDVRANTTLATPLIEGRKGLGESYTLVGHKWFTSAPMCDFFITLAKTSTSPHALSCFLVPRFHNEQYNEGFRVMRLKDKLADRANASSEIEYHNAVGVMVGEEGQGVKTIMEMVQATRLDCALGSAGGARRALQLALNHTSSRSAFGKPLIDQPLMQNVLTDLCVESEAHTLLAMYVSSLYDCYYNTKSSEHEKDLFRIAVSISKYYVTKRLPHFTYECMECMGGNGFVEDFPMAKLFRHSPLNAIWEGSGNVLALDIAVRAAQHLFVLLEELRQYKGKDRRLDGLITYLDTLLMNRAKQLKSGKISEAEMIEQQRMSRHIVDRFAIALQAALLIEYGNKHVAEGYLASRLPAMGENMHTGNSQGSTYGAHVFTQQQSKEIIERNVPVFTKK